MGRVVLESQCVQIPADMSLCSSWPSRAPRSPRTLEWLQGAVRPALGPAAPGAQGRACPSQRVCPLQIRVPAFLDLFMQSLFKPGARINQDHKHKYIHILAYAASVVETWKKVLSGTRVPLPWGMRAERNHEPIWYQKCLF